MKDPIQSGHLDGRRFLRLTLTTQSQYSIIYAAFKNLNNSAEETMVPKRSIFNPLPIRRWPGDVKAERAYIMQELERIGMRNREGNSSRRSVLTNAEMASLVADNYGTDKFLKTVRARVAIPFLRERPDQLRHVLSVSLSGKKIY